VICGMFVLLAFGVLGYFPHRLEEVELLSDVGRTGQHVCIAHHDDWGEDFCRARGEGLPRGWHAGAPSCVAADQHRPTRLDVALTREIDGGTRPFVLSPYLPDRPWLVEQVEDCDWMEPQLRTVGGLIPPAGPHDPDHPYWGAYRIGPQMDVRATLPPVGTPITVDREVLAGVVSRIRESPAWQRLGAAGHTWGQLVQAGLVVWFEGTPVAGTPVPAWLALALWAHAVVEVYDLYGQGLVAELGLPPQIPAADRRLLTLRDAIRGLFATDAHVETRIHGWGTLKAGFDLREGG